MTADWQTVRAWVTRLFSFKVEKVGCAVDLGVVEMAGGALANVAAGVLDDGSSLSASRNIQFLDLF